MRAPRLALVLALAVAAPLLAGCLGGTSANPPTDQPPATPSPKPAGEGGEPGSGLNATGGAANDTADIVVKATSGTASGVSPSVPGVATFSVGAPGSDHSSDKFDVKAGVTGIVLEVVWNGTDAMDAYVSPPCSSGDDPTGTGLQCPQGGANTNGTKPAKVVIVDPKLMNMTGSWSWAVYPQQNVQGVAFTAYLSLFYGPVPTDSYTAIKPGG